MASQEPASKKVRISLDLTIPFYDRLDALERITQAESKAGVIRQALQVYEYMARRIMDGYSFEAVGPDGNREKLVFFSTYVPAQIEESVLSR